MPEAVQTPDTQGGTDPGRLHTIDLSFFGEIAGTTPELAGKSPLVIKNKVLQDPQFRNRVASRRLEQFKATDKFDKNAYDALSDDQKKAKDNELLAGFDKEIYDRAIRASYSGQGVADAVAKRRSEVDQNEKELNYSYLRNVAETVKRRPEDFKSFGLSDGFRVTADLDSEEGLIQLNQRRMSDPEFAKLVERGMFSEFQKSIEKKGKLSDSLSSDDMVYLYSLYSTAGPAGMDTYLKYAEAKERKVGNDKEQAGKNYEIREYEKQLRNIGAQIEKSERIAKDLNPGEITLDPTATIRFGENTMNWNLFTAPGFVKEESADGFVMREKSPEVAFESIVKTHLGNQFSDEEIREAYFALQAKATATSSPYRRITNALFEKAKTSDEFDVADVMNAFRMPEQYGTKEESSNLGFFGTLMFYSQPSVPGTGLQNKILERQPATMETSGFFVNPADNAPVQKLALDVLRKDDSYNQAVAYDKKGFYVRDYEKYRDLMTRDNVDLKLRNAAIIKDETLEFNPETGEYTKKQKASEDFLPEVWNGLVDGVYHLPSALAPFTVDPISRVTQLVGRMEGKSWDEVDVEYNRFRDFYYNPYTEEYNEGGATRFLSSMVPSLMALRGPMALWAALPKTVFASGFVKAAEHMTAAGRAMSRVVPLGQLGNYAPNLARFNHLKKVGEALKSTGAYGIDFTVGSAVNSAYIGAVGENQQSVVGNGFMDFALNKAFDANLDLQERYKASGAAGRMLFDVAADASLGIFFDTALSGIKAAGYAPLRMLGQKGDALMTSFYGRYTGQTVGSLDPKAQAKIGKPIIAPDFVNMFTKTGFMDLFDEKAGLMTPQEFHANMLRDFHASGAATVKLQTAAGEEELNALNMNLRAGLDEMNTLLGGDLVGDMEKVLREYDRSAGLPARSDEEYKNLADQQYQTWATKTAEHLSTMFGVRTGADPELKAIGDDNLFRIVDTLRTWSGDTVKFATDNDTGALPGQVHHSDATRIAGQDPGNRTVLFTGLDKNNKATYIVMEHKPGNWAMDLADELEKRLLREQTPEAQMKAYMEKNPNATNDEIIEYFSKNVVPVGRTFQFIDAKDNNFRKVGRIVGKNADGTFNAVDNATGEYRPNVVFELDPNRPSLPVLRAKDEPTAIVPYGGKKIEPDKTSTMPGYRGRVTLDGGKIAVTDQVRTPKNRIVQKIGRNKQVIYTPNDKGEMVARYEVTTKKTRDGKVTRQVKRLDVEQVDEAAVLQKQKLDAELKQREIQEATDADLIRRMKEDPNTLTDAEIDKILDATRPEPAAEVSRSVSPWMVPRYARKTVETPEGDVTVEYLDEPVDVGAVQAVRQMEASDMVQRVMNPPLMLAGETVQGQLLQRNTLREQLKNADLRLTQDELGIVKLTKSERNGLLQERKRLQEQYELLSRGETPETRVLRLDMVDKVARAIDTELSRGANVDPDVVVELTRQLMNLADEEFPVYRDGKKVGTGRRDVDGMGRLLHMDGAGYQHQIKLHTKRAEILQNLEEKNVPHSKIISELEKEIAAREKRLAEMLASDKKKSGVPQLKEAIERRKALLKKLKTSSDIEMVMRETELEMIKEQLDMVADMQARAMAEAGMAPADHVEALIDTLSLRDGIYRRLSKMSDFIERKLGMRLDSIRRQVAFYGMRPIQALADLPNGPITSLIRARVGMNEREYARSLIVQTGIDNPDLLFALDRKGRRVLAANQQDTPFTVYDPTKAVRKGVIVLMPEPGGTVGLYMAQHQLPANTPPKSQFVMTDDGAIIRDPNWVRVGVNQMVENGKLMHFAPVEIAPGEFIFRRVESDQYVDTVHLNLQRPVMVAGISDLTDVAYRDMIQGNGGDGFVFFNDKNEMFVVPASFDQAFDKRTLATPTMTEHKRMAAQQAERTRTTGGARIEGQAEIEPYIPPRQDVNPQASLFDEPQGTEKMIDAIAEDLQKQMPFANRSDVLKVAGGLGLLAGAEALGTDNNNTDEAGISYLMLGLAAPAMLSKSLNTKLRTVFTSASKPGKEAFKRYANAVTGAERRQKMADKLSGIYGYSAGPNTPTGQVLVAEGAKGGTWREQFDRIIKRATTTNLGFMEVNKVLSPKITETIDMLRKIRRAPDMWIYGLKNQFSADTGKDLFEFSNKIGPAEISRMINADPQLLNEMNAVLDAPAMLAADTMGSNVPGWFGSAKPRVDDEIFGQRMLMYYTMYKTEGVQHKGVARLLNQHPTIQKLFDAMDAYSESRMVDVNGNMVKQTFNPFQKMIDTTNNAFRRMALDYEMATRNVILETFTELMTMNQDVANAMKGLLNFSGTPKEYMKMSGMAERDTIIAARKGTHGAMTQKMVETMFEAQSSWQRFDNNRKNGYFPNRVWMDGLNSMADAIRRNLGEDPSLAGRYQGLPLDAQVNGILSSFIAGVNGVDVYNVGQSGRIKTGYLRNFNPDTQEFEDAYFTTTLHAEQHINELLKHLSKPSYDAAMGALRQKLGKVDFDIRDLIEEDFIFVANRNGGIDTKAVYRIRMDELVDIPEFNNMVVQKQFDHLIRSLRGQVRSRPSNHLERQRTWDIPMELVDHNFERVIRGYAYDAAPRVERVKNNIWDQSDFGRRYLYAIKEDMVAKAARPEVVDETLGRIEALYYTIHGLDPEIESRISDPALREEAYSKKIATSNIVAGMKRLIGIKNLPFRWAVMDSFTIPLLSPYYHGNAVTKNLFKQLYNREPDVKELEQMMKDLGMVRNEMSYVTSGLDEEMNYDAVGLTGKFSKFVKQVSDRFANISISSAYDAARRAAGQDVGSKLDRSYAGRLVPLWNSFMDIQTANTMAFGISSIIKLREVAKIVGEMDSKGVRQLERVETPDTNYTGTFVNEQAMIDEIRALGFYDVKTMDDLRSLISDVNEHTNISATFRNRDSTVTNYSAEYKKLAASGFDPRRVAAGMRGHRAIQTALLNAKDILHATDPLYQTPLSLGQTRLGAFGGLVTQYTQFTTNVGLQGIQQRLRVPLKDFSNRFPQYGDKPVAEMIFAMASKNPRKALLDLGIAAKDVDDVIAFMPVHAYSQALRIPQLMGTSVAMYMTRDAIEDMLALPFGEIGEEWMELKREMVINPFAEKDEQMTWGDFFNNPELSSFMMAVMPRIGYELSRSGAIGAFGSYMYEIPNYADSPADIIPIMSTANDFWQIGRTGLKVVSDPDDIEKIPPAIMNSVLNVFPVTSFTNTYRRMAREAVRNQFDVRTQKGWTPMDVYSVDNPFEFSGN